MAAQAGMGNIQEMRRMARCRKPEASAEGGKKRPALGAGKHGAKGNKEIPENELELKVMENEFRRRQWLMNWQMEVVEMQNELYEMEQSLQRSMVRSDSTKVKDRQAKTQTTSPHMTEAELEKLPVRMRPRPKYAPYTSRKERSEINLKNYEKVIQNLHDNPRKFAVITPDIATSGQPAFPEIAMTSAEDFKVLLLRNPFYKHRERDEMLIKMKMEPNWQYSSRGMAPKKMIVSSRTGDPTSLPSLRPASMGDSRENKNLSSRGTDKAVRFSSDDPLPAIVPPNKHHAADMKKSPRDGIRASTKLPTVSEKKESVKPVLPQGKTLPKQRPATSDGSRSISARTSPTDSTFSSFTDSDISSEAARQRAKRKQEAKDAKKAKQAPPSMPAKNQPDLLKDPEYRRSLLADLEKRRQERIAHSKWGLVKNVFKATNVLKVQMPDVIRDSTTSKHHNRAIDQVQERIKARAAKENKDKESLAMASGSNLLKSKGMSQSMPLLAR